MSILDKAVEHFDSKETIEIDVPEWETVIYATPFTLAEQRKLYKFAKDDDMEFLVRAIILKAMDKDGEKIFDLSDKQKMMNRVDPKVLSRIATEMSASESVEDQLGN